MYNQVLIVSPRDDIHSLSVKYRIQRIYGNNVLCKLFDGCTYPIASELDWIMCEKEITPRLRISPGLSSHANEAAAEVLQNFDKSANIELKISDETVVWFRRYTRPIIFPEVTVPELIRYCKYSLSTSLMAALNSCTIVNQPYFEDCADLKPLQLLLAQKVGLNIPETLISSNQEEIKNFIFNANKKKKKLFSRN